MNRRRSLTILAGLCGAVALAGCGVASSVNSVVDPVAEAATVAQAGARTGTVPGFRYRGTLTIVAGTDKTVVTEHGAMNTITGIEAVHERLRVGRRTIPMHVLYRGGTLYMYARPIPGFSRVAGSRSWIKLDLGRAYGIRYPSVGYNPAEFVDFLHAPEIVHVTPMGTQSVNGVPATLYQVTVALNRHVRAAPRRRRAAAAQIVAFVERETGSHTFKEDVWVDRSGLIRQVSFGFTECVGDESVTTSMLVDLSHFGPQRTATLPRHSATLDITGRVRAGVKQAEQLQPRCSQFS